MKKHLLFFFCCCYGAVNAQLKVCQDGSVQMGYELGVNDPITNQVSIGVPRSYNNINLTALSASLADNPYFYGFRVAVFGDGTAYAGSNIYNIGVLGKTGNSYNTNLTRIAGAFVPKG